MDIFRQYGAKAIWADHEEKLNRYVRFQTSFCAVKTVKTEFYICTDTKYELYINGQLAGFGQYEDFPTQKVYDVYDISKYLIDGENLVSVLAFSQGENSLQHMVGLPMVIFAAAANDSCLLVSDSSVKCCEKTEFTSGEFERIDIQRSFNFGFDLRNDDGWRAENVSGSWQNAVICDDSEINYQPRPNHNLVLSEIRKGKVVTQGVFSLSEGDNVSLKMQYASLAYREKTDVLAEDGTALRPLCDNVYWIADLGEETAGYFALDVEAEEGSVIWVACGEQLDDLRVRSATGGRNFAFQCICREGRQKLRFYIRRIAGRYLQFFAHSGIRAVYGAGLHKVDYPLDFNGMWKSSDRLFNRIYDVCKNTLHLCMHEHYEDCPQREQALYAMDSRNQMLCGYYTFGETVMPRASLELLAQSQNADGMLEMCAPSIFELVIPSFALTWVMALSEYALFTGDMEFTKKMQPVARNVLNYFIGRKKDGLILRANSERDWNFYEWTDHMDNWGVNADIICDAPLNAFCIMALSAYERISDWLHMPEEISWALQQRQELTAVFHDSFYVPEKGAYKNYITKTEPDSFSQLTQSLALLAGCVPKTLEKEVRKKLLSDELVETSLSYLMFKYDALLAEPETYGNYVLDDIERQWGYMLYEGATSFWETIFGASDFDRAGSLCHGWSAVPAYIFWRYVMGIYPTRPGEMPEVAVPVCGEELSACGELKMPTGFYRVTKNSLGVRIEKQ